MCGRYRLSRRKQIVEEYFDSAGGRRLVASIQRRPDSARPGHPPESEGASRDFRLVRWGLIPSWAKDSSGAARMINARSETAATLPAFRDAMRSRRCLIPADGFYEWQKTWQDETAVLL